MTTSDQPQWTVRYRTGRPVLPRYAPGQPDRCVHLVRTGGLPELVAWDQATGRQRRVTDEAVRYAIDHTGAWVWWFADGAGRGVGSWWREPFEGGPAERMTPPDFAPAGLAFSQRGFAVGAFGGGCTRVWCDGTERRFEGDWSVAASTMDGELLALSTVGPAGPRRAEVVVLRAAVSAKDVGAEIARLPDYGGRRVVPLAFSPDPADHRLLLLHEAHGRTSPLLWDPVTATTVEPYLGLVGDLRAEWATDGRSLLLCELVEGGSRLLRYRLAPARLTEIPTGPGFVHDATSRPDDAVEYLRSSTVDLPEVRSTTGRVLLRSEHQPAAAEVWPERVDGPGGSVPVLVSRPMGTAGSRPTIFILHGGPATHDTDSFNPYAAAWLDHGFCVVRVNYRGSTGFGRAWREPAGYRPGLTELEDVDAVRQWVVDTGLADPTRLVVAGSSWGGYLSLLAIGRQPHAWSLAIAEAPIADFAAAYETETERLRALDRSLFGGSPAEQPERYRESSPMTYVEHVRAPVLLTTGAHDPRCPPEPVRRYADRLRAHGIEVVLDEHPAGHGSLDIAERIGQVRRQLDFVTGRLCLDPSYVDRQEVAWPRS